MTPPKTTLDQALELAAQGFRVFPCIPNGKLPAIRKMLERATCDPAAIRAMWTRFDPVLELETIQPYNIGIATGRLGDGTPFFVLDEDVKNGAKGKESLAALDAMRGTPGWAKTRTVGTASGGRHFYFVSDRPVGSSASRIAPGLDIRGEGGFVVAPGSTIDGRAYVDHGGDLRQAPAWLVELAGAPRVRAADASEFKCEPDQPANIERATYYLEHLAPIAIQGDGGDDQTFKVACGVRDLGISEPLCLELMLEHYNPRCEPPWDLEELAVKVANAYTYAKGAAGAKSPEADFEPVEDQAAEEEQEIPTQGKRPKLFFKLARDIQPDLSRTDLVDHWLGTTAMSVVYGDSNVGKTFIALSIAFAVAMGRLWHTHRTERGGVVYVAAEAGSSAEKRIEALKLHHGVKDFPIALVPCPVDLLRTTGDTGALIELIAAAEKALGVPVRLIVIDTLSRAMAGGNENAPEDMTAYVANSDRIKNATKAHVMHIHHCGKDAARGARGHSSLRAATDTEIEVVAGTIRGTKQRDLEIHREINFTLRSVPIGVRFDGQPVTSAVVEFCAPDEGWPAASEESLTPREIRAIQERIASADDWREDIRAKKWAGKAIAEALGLNLKAEGVKAQIKVHLRHLVKEGALVRKNSRDAHRHWQWFIHVGKRVKADA